MAPARALCKYFCLILVTALFSFIAFMYLLPKLSVYEIPASEGSPAHDVLVTLALFNDTLSVHASLATDSMSFNSTPIATVNNSTLSDHGHNNRYKMVVGILSAKRNPPTVIKMVQELARPINGTEDYKLIVWLSESASNDTETVKELSELGASVFVNTHPYPELDKNRLKIMYDDPVSRIIWRTSHVLDYANLLEMALRYNSEFVMILEDDLKPAKFALDKSYQFANKHFSNTTTHTQWGMLTMYSGVRREQHLHQSMGSLCFCGACALVIRKKLIPDFIKFLRQDPYAAPVDMMLWNFTTERRLYTYERTPNLFQHISLRSTYTGKDQKKRRSEEFRSISFEFDEDNRTVIPGYDSKGGYVGCFKDNIEDRDFIGLFSLSMNKGASELCEDFCNGYYYFALQNGGECFCGNQFGKHGAAPEDDCNYTCKSDTTKMCGGALRNSVYRTTSLFYSYVGCFIEESGFSGKRGTMALLQNNAFPGKCKEFCRHQQHFAVYGGKDCFCLDSLSGLAEEEISLCSQPCSGNRKHKCGGKTAPYISVYKLAATVTRL